MREEGVMKVMTSEWKDRIGHWIRVLKEDFYEPLGEFSWEAFRTTEHFPVEEVWEKQFVPVETGFTWGNTWEYCWFRSRVVLPKEADGKRIVMKLSPGGESTLFVNGKAFGTYRAEWVHEQHHFFEDNVLSRCGAEGQEFSVLMETYAGHYFEEAPNGGCATGPVLEGLYKDPLTQGARRTLGTCTYGIWNEEAYQLFVDVDTLYKLYTTLDDRSLRAVKIAEALEAFTLIVDFEQTREERNRSYREAREVLRPALEAVNGSTMPVFYAVGNAHLDLAWLWPMAETYRKTERTFAAQLRLIEEYPEYKYVQSQPAAYEMCREHYPELFERITQAIKDGQWIADGAMWVEPDTNMAGGEALIRQLLHGKRYYREVLGTESKVLWLPDTFGYSAALPQILQGCGVPYMVTQKIFWSYNDGEQFPYHYFTWEGMDGSRVTSFLPTSYGYRTDPAEVNKAWQNRVQVRDLEAFLLPFGYGDGGGGPTRDHLEYARRQENLEGGVRVKMTSPLEFFEEMDEKGGPANAYVGELYFSAHRGTYTSQAMVKQNNRRCELALREMEMWSSIAWEKGAEYDLPRADKLWKKLLLHQFHDILPGSSIARVYVEAEKAYGEILQGAEDMTQMAQNALLKTSENGTVTVMNSLAFERTALVEVPDIFREGARTVRGENVPVQVIEDKVKALVKLPSCGVVSIEPVTSECAVGDVEAVSVIRDGANYRMENQWLRSVINSKGEVVSFVLKESGREFAGGTMNRFRLYKDVPRLFDAWDIDSHYADQEVEAAAEVCVEPVAAGLEGVLKVTGRISNSTFTQYIRLAADSRRLEFETEVDWREVHRLLKADFPVNVYSENVINEIQFGFVERPAHRSRVYDRDRYEVCNHRYSAFCDGAHGAAVLNDCKYGISANGNALQLSLLRASTCPEMRADNRVHHFTYAFTAWEGTFPECDVVRQGYELNVKPRVAAGVSQMFSAASVDRPNIILETMKPAEDGSGDIILRLYEAQKAAVSSALQLNLGDFRAYLCDMLENIQEELEVDEGTVKLDFRAFEIKTVRVRRMT